MRVLQVVLSLKYGGLEKLVIQLSKMLNDQGVVTKVVSLQPNGDLAKEARDQGIEVIELDKKDGFDRSIILKLRKIIKDNKIDIVHTHNLAPLIYGTLASKLAGVKCINTRHGRAEKKTWGLIWNLNHCIVTVSEDTKEALLKTNRIKRRKLKVIYNGIDLSKFNGAIKDNNIDGLKKELGIEEDKFIIGNVGRIVKEKDQETLLKAFRKLRRKEFKGSLVIVGDGPLKEHLKKAAKEMGIEKDVKFLGFRSDINRLMRLFDVFVLSSFMEGVPLTILEAMGAGKPVIATNVGGNREVVLEDKSGILVPCGYPERIETAIMRLFINKKMAAQMGDEGRRLAEEKFSLESMTENYFKIYKEAVNGC